MNFIQNLRTLSLLGACALALASRADASGSYHNHNGTNSWTQYEYIDFTSTGGVGHDATYNTQAFSPGNTVKYFPIQITNNSSTEGICYELRTGAPTFYPAATGDTRIWTYNTANSTYKSLDDDGGDGNFSLGRAFIKGPGAWLNVYWAGYNSAANSIHFGTWITRLNLTEAQCTTGQATVPWVKVIGGVMTYSANAN